jgi:hypothetical protein
MKKIENFLINNPGYIKWGNERLAEKLGLSETTVRRFKNSNRFKVMSRSYRQSITTW